MNTHTHRRKSSYSKGQDTCLEITDTVPGQVRIRDSKLGTASPILTVRTPEWHALIAAIRTGELDT